MAALLLRRRASVGSGSRRAGTRGLFFARDYVLAAAGSRRSGSRPAGVSVATSAVAYTGVVSSHGGARTLRGSWLHLTLGIVAVLQLVAVNFWPRFESPNERARAYQALAVVSRGSLEIGAEVERFGGMEDVAIAGGRLFPNKAPGTLPLVLPGALLAHRVAADDPEDELRLVLVLGRLLAASLPFAVCVLLLARAHGRLSARRPARRRRLRLGHTGARRLAPAVLPRAHGVPAAGRVPAVVRLAAAALAGGDVGRAPPCVGRGVRVPGRGAGGGGGSRRASASRPKRHGCPRGGGSGAGGAARHLQRRLLRLAVRALDRPRGLRLVRGPGAARPVRDLLADPRRARRAAVLPESRPGGLGAAGRARGMPARSRGHAGPRVSAPGSP